MFEVNRERSRFTRSHPVHALLVTENDVEALQIFLVEFEFAQGDADVEFDEVLNDGGVAIPLRQIDRPQSVLETLSCRCGIGRHSIGGGASRPGVAEFLHGVQISMLRRHMQWRLPCLRRRLERDGVGDVVDDVDDDGVVEQHLQHQRSLFCLISRNRREMQRRLTDLEKISVKISIEISTRFWRLSFASRSMSSAKTSGKLNATAKCTAASPP